MSPRGINIVKVPAIVGTAYEVLTALRAVCEADNAHPNGARAKDVADRINTARQRARPIGSTERVELVKWQDVYPVLCSLARQGAIHEVRRCRPHGARATPRFRAHGT